MKNKLTAAGLLAFLLLLTGCQLARANGDAEAMGQEDRLVGVVITKEYLDLFDFEAYLSDHFSDFTKGGEIAIDGNSRYAGRIYATLKSTPLTNEETGEEVLHWEHEFEDLDGFALFCAQVAPPEGGSTYWAAYADDGISDVSFATGDKNALEGTLYVLPESPTEFYINPVCQSADGSVYLTAGQGYSASGNADEGAVYTQTLTQTKTVTENGETRERSDSVTVHIAVKYPVERVRVLQMDEGNRQVAQTEYVSDMLPEGIALDANTAYLIVERQVVTPEGRETRRELLGREAATFLVYTARPNGVCAGQPVRLDWE